MSTVKEEKVSKRRGPKPIDPNKRFRKYVNKKGGIREGMRGHCHEWEGCFDTFGHPVFGYSPSLAVKAHRFAYEQKKGKLKKGERVVRICENPKCVNASHVVKQSEVKKD
jgi:hypothetical protein